MSEADRGTALNRLERGRRVESMIEILEGLLAGRMTRASVHEWIESDWPQCWRDVGLPGNANFVLGALWNIDDRDDHGRDYVGEPELRAYLDVLRGGESLIVDHDPLIGLSWGVDVLAERVGGQPIHWIYEGTGWEVEIRFCTRASGRAFNATGGGIYKSRHDPWREALIDLFEGLAIDERDVTWLNPKIDLAQLPEWALWREDDNANRFEIERSHCFAKLDRQEQILRDRGHKQSYWVDPVG
jgi:hypothetical protein